MANVCFYFELHQPWRIDTLDLFGLNGQKDYFDIDGRKSFANSKVMQKVAEKSYRPMLSLLKTLTIRHPEFCWSISVTGTALEQIEQFCPDVLEILKELVKTKRVELISETYYHSLAGLYSKEEFVSQIKLHQDKLKSLFGVKPKVFRNTELIYTNRIAEIIKELGFKAMLAEGADRVMGWRSPTFVYQSPAGLPILTKHYKLSDDIAFRFSESSRSDKPLLAETFSHWINSSFANDEYVNLFMDFETFGEHQWEDTGIFKFFEKFIEEFITHGGRFVTPTEEAKSLPVGIYDSETPVSWADVDRDITAWRGNEMQEDCLRVVYQMEEKIKASNDQNLINDWRKLQTSDHFYYMCTKWSADGDVHAYFSPYGSPFAAYSNYNNVLADLVNRLFNRYRYGKSSSIG